jgi:hypothetical protein
MNIHSGALGLPPIRQGKGNPNKEEPRNPFDSEALLILA